MLHVMWRAAAFPHQHISFCVSKRMEPTLLLCTLFLVCWCQQGSSAVKHVFVKSGDDVQLNLTQTDEPEDFVFIKWHNSKNDLVVIFYQQQKTEVHYHYTGRVEFPAKKYSIKLKNLQKADSGRYYARAIKALEEPIIAEYNITVQDPVSPVKLTVDSVSSSSDSCNLTVSCSTQDSHINTTFTCENNTCSQEGGERSEVTTSGASLHIYLVNASIICNHSNQVSWTEKTKILDLCWHADSLQHSSITGVIVAAVISVAALIVIIIGAVVYIQKYRKCKSETFENTVYASPVSPRVPANSLDSTYCLVGQHSAPIPPTQTEAKPESVYAQVVKAPRK